MSDLRDRQLAQLTGPFSRPALVVVDVQRDFADPDRLGAYGLTDTALATLDRTVTRIAELVDTARAAEVPVVWVELGSDPARPWRSSNWLREGDYDAPMSPDEPCRVGTPGAEWYQMQPEKGSCGSSSAATAASSAPISTHGCAPPATTGSPLSA